MFDTFGNARSNGGVIVDIWWACMDEFELLVEYYSLSSSGKKEMLDYWFREVFPDFNNAEELIVFDRYSKFLKRLTEEMREEAAT